MTQKRSHAWALLLALVSYTAWTCGDVFLKSSSHYQLPIQEIMACWGLSCAAWILLTVGVRKEYKRLIPNNKTPVLLRGLFTAGMAFCNINALQHLPLANFYVSIFTSPLLISLAAAAFLNEPLSRSKIEIIICGFIGVVIASDPSALISGHGDAQGYLWAFGGVLMFVAVQILLRRMANTETPECLIFFGRGTLGLAGAIMCIGQVETLPWFVLAMTVAAGACSAIGDFNMAQAMRRTSAATISSLHYWQLIPGAILGYILWNDKPTWHLIIGAAIIVMSGFAMAHHTKKAPHEMAST